MRTLRRLLYRCYQVAIANPLQALVFVQHLGGSLLQSIEALGTAAWKSTVALYVRQAVKAVGRGLVLIPLLAISLWLLAARIGAGTGELGRRVIESYVIVTAVRDVLPLLIALLLVIREGGPLVIRFALPQWSGRDVRSPRQRIRLVFPTVLAGTLAGALFYFALTVAVLAGYLSDGPLAEVPGLDVFETLESRTLRGPFYFGLAKAALFGAVITHVALALGWKAGAMRQRHRAGRRYPHHDIWEAATLSLIICFGVTLVGRLPQLQAP